MYSVSKRKQNNTFNHQEFVRVLVRKKVMWLAKLKKELMIYLENKGEHVIGQVEKGIEIEKKIFLENKGKRIKI